MVMPAGDAVDLFKIYIDDWKKNREQIDLVDRWYRGALLDEDKPALPTKKTREYQELRDRSMTRWLKLAVTVLAQTMYVEGYQTADGAQAEPWTIWQANGLDARQIAVHRGALAHGQSFVSVLPGDPHPKMRGHSARSMIALYQDPAEDEWPMYALSGKPIKNADGKAAWRFRLWDEDAIYVIDTDESCARPTYITHDIHGGGETPIVRFPCEIDLDGRVEGEVEPNIDLAARIDQTVFDRLVVQHFQAWAVRYATGLVEPETNEEKQALKLKLAMEDILISENSEAKFGVLPPTPMDGLYKGHESDLRDFAAVMQVTPVDLLGQMINISAEALAAAEAGKMRKGFERKKTSGESWEQSLRFAAHLAGDSKAANDLLAQVVWADHESRSLAQVADALGKMVTMLGIPPSMVWDRIPGVSQTDVARWKAEAEKLGTLDQTMLRLFEGTVPGADGDDGGTDA